MKIKNFARKEAIRVRRVRTVASLKPSRGRREKFFGVWTSGKGINFFCVRITEPYTLRLDPYELEDGYRVAHLEPKGTPYEGVLDYIRVRAEKIALIKKGDLQKLQAGAEVEFLLLEPGDRISEAELKQHGYL